MPSTIQKLVDKGLIRPPTFLPSNVMYETIMGSVAYGVSSDTSDMDVYGYCIPPKYIVFPHLNGEIMGFGTEIKRFEQYQQHHINCPDELGGKGRVYDVQIYNIVKYFQLCMDNNPNMIDSLFTPQECILHITGNVGAMVRENRHIFLHQGAWHKFKGYAYSQLHMTDTKRKDEHYEEVRRLEEAYQIPHETEFEVVESEAVLRGIGVVWTGENKDGRSVDGSNPLFGEMTNSEFHQYYFHFKAGMEKTTRFYRVKSAGTDLKFLYHVVRLLDECEQIMTTGDLDLRRNNEHLKAIRRGEVSEDDVRKWDADKEKQLEGWYGNPKCAVPFKKQEEKIKELLMNCLEHHYGNLSECVVRDDAAVRALRELAEVVDKHRALLS